MQSCQYLWDDKSVRYQLVQSNGGFPYNWLFVPGGPGADSAYLFSLINGLRLPGNVWLVDFPANGSNETKEEQDYDFNRWFDCFLPAISKFSNPMYVGHSFGGMLPLLFPQLEDILNGFVLLSSAPCLWLEEATRVAQQKNIQVFSEPIEEFGKNPNPETFKKAITACLPYYFPPNSLKQGKRLLENLPFNYHAANWWLNKASEINFNAVWIPKEVPTLILGGSEDCMTPSTLFKKDIRFNRKNIINITVEGGGHMPWIEKMEEVKHAFHLLLSECMNVQQEVVEFIDK